MSLIRKLANETAMYGLSSIIGRLTNALLLVPLHTNTLPKADYGIVIQFYVYSGFLMVLYSYRMESAFFRFGTPEEDRNRTFSTGLWSLVFSSVAISLLAMLFANPIAHLLQFDHHADYVRYFALILAFDCLSELPFARLRLEQRPLRFVTLKMVNIGITVVLNLFWLLFCPWASKEGYGWVSYFWSPSNSVKYIFLANLIASTVTIVLLLPTFRAIFQTKFDRTLWQDMLRYAGPLIIVSLAGITNEMLDRLILPYLLTGTREENMAQLGVYGANYKLAALITLFTQAYRYAAEPFFFKNAQKDNALQTQADVTKWFTIAAVTGMLLILLFIDIFKYYIGSAYREGLMIVPIILMANVLLGIYYNVSVWYRLKDRTGTGAWIALAGSVFTVLMLIFFVPKMGYIAAAWAHLICYAYMTVATWWMGKAIHPVPYDIKRMALYIGVALLLYMLSIPLPYLLGQGIVIWIVRMAFFCTYIYMVYLLEIRKKQTAQSA